MLMICSSLARNRSPDPVVACCFGRIVPSDAARESWFAQKENRKTKLQASGAASRKILQSQIAQSSGNRFTFNRLAVVHGRLPTGVQVLKGSRYGLTPSGAIRVGRFPEYSWQFPEYDTPVFPKHRFEHRVSIIARRIHPVHEC